MDTVQEPVRDLIRTDVDKATERYRWSLTGAAGVVELVVLDVLPLGRAVAERLAVHSPIMFPDAEEHGACPALGADGHCVNYDLLGDRLARAWNNDRDDERIWAHLAGIYNTLPAVTQ